LENASIMHNKYICFIAILIVLVISSCNCHRRSGNTSDCVAYLESKNISIDTSKEIDEYVKEVTNQFSGLKQKEIEKSYYNCTKPELIRYYLNAHPQIDSVIITPSGHGISFYRIDKNVWSNIIFN